MLPWEHAKNSLKLRAGTRENGLVLLLEVLRDRTDPGDAFHGRLDQLAREVSAQVSAQVSARTWTHS